MVGVGHGGGWLQVGLNFTAAAMAVFAELSFTPGDLLQVPANTEQMISA